MVRSRLRLRPFVALAIAAIAAGITVGVLSGREPPRAPAKAPVALTEASFRSRPDLTPPLMTVKTRLPAATKGKLLLAPTLRGGQSGPAIIYERVRLQWFHPMRNGVIA